MLTYSRSLFAITIFLLCYSAALGQQCPVMPAGTLCITQAAGNEVRQNKLELEATKAENVILKQAVADRDADIKTLQETGKKNVADLADRLHKTEVDYATAQGNLIGAQAEITRLTVMTQFLLTNGRKK